MKNFFLATVENGHARLARRRDSVAPSGGNPYRQAAIRPEDLVVSRTAPPPENACTYRGTVSAVVGCGFGHEVCVRAEDLTFTAKMTRRALMEEQICEGANVFISFDPVVLHVW